MHRQALRVEELQAQRRRHAGIGRRLADGEACMPAAEEQAQVDDLAQREPHRVAAGHFLVDAGLLVHRGLVARERQHGAAQLQRLQQLDPRALQPRGAQCLVVHAGVRRNGGAFAQAHGRGGVLVAHALGTQFGETGADVFGIHRVSFVVREVAVRLRSPPRARR
ncbi:hypothetical protein D3C72_1580280 [compost metagenome]